MDAPTGPLSIINLYKIAAVNHMATASLEHASALCKEHQLKNDGRTKDVHTPFSATILDSRRLFFTGILQRNPKPLSVRLLMWLVCTRDIHYDAEI